jgi:hypothetical protein
MVRKQAPLIIQGGFMGKFGNINSEFRIPQINKLVCNVDRNGVVYTGMAFTLNNEA